MNRERDAQREYEFGHSDREQQRLMLQAREWEPFTQHLFQDAGLSPGMRVLDIGSGTGDVAFLAARMVSPGGEVLGVDVAPAAVETATARAKALGLQNVRFLTGNAAEMNFGGEFDALVGRLILMHVPRPAEFLKKLAADLRPGGLVAFQEIDAAVGETFPPSPTMERSRKWAMQALSSLANPRMGMDLYRSFIAAGLSAPQMRLDANIGGSDSVHVTLTLEVFRTILPMAEKMGLVSAGEVDPETLEERIREELRSLNGIVRSPALIGAWSRKP